MPQLPDEILQEDLDFNKQLFIDYANNPNTKLDYLKFYKIINQKITN